MEAGKTDIARAVVDCDYDEFKDKFKDNLTARVTNSVQDLKNLGSLALIVCSLASFIIITLRITILR